MRLPLVDGAEDFTRLYLKPAALAGMGLPVFPYPLRTAALHELLGRGGQVEIRDLALGLMDWLDHTDDPEPALDVLEELLARHCPPDGKDHGRCWLQAENGWLHSFYLGMVDWSGPVAAWQRCEWIVAAACPASHEAGRMLVAAPKPITLAVARSIFAHAAPLEHGAPSDSMAALRRSADSFGSFYSWEAGRETVIYWGRGLGWQERGEELVHDGVTAMPNTALPPNQLAWQVALANGYA